MALLPLFRAALAALTPGPRRTVRRPRLALQSLESREVPAVGGGFTAGGINGQYFPHPNLAGNPAFVRRDVHVDFGWQGSGPGGSTSPEYEQVGATNFSVRWTGQVVPRFSETYTFHTVSDDGVRLWIRPTGAANWTLIIDHWSPHGSADDFGSY